MKKVSIAVLIIIVLNVSMSVAVGAVGLSTYTINNSGANKYKGFMLPYEFYALSKPDFSDVQILDSEGNSVPYFVNSYEPDPALTEVTYPLTLTSQTENDNSWVFDFSAPESFPIDGLSTAISFTADSDHYAKTVEISGNDIYGEIKPFKRGQIFHVGNREWEIVAFDKPVTSTKFRVKISKTEHQQVKLTGGTLHFNPEKLREVKFLEIRQFPCKMEHPDTNYEVHVSGLKNIEVKNMTLDCPTNFDKPIEFIGKIKQIYKLPIAERSAEKYTDLFLPFDRNKLTEDELVMTIKNDDASHDIIELGRVSVAFYVDELIFEAKPDENYTLSFNDENYNNPPKYSIADQKVQILQEGYDAVKLTNFQTPITEAPIRDSVESNPTTGIIITITVILLILLVIYIFNDRLKKR